MLLEVWGTPDSLRLLLGAGLIFPVLGWFWLGADRVLAGLAAALVGLLVFWPTSNQFWARLHGVEPGPGPLPRTPPD